MQNFYPTIYDEMRGFTVAEELTRLLSSSRPAVGSGHKAFDARVYIEKQKAHKQKLKQTEREQAMRQAQLQEIINTTREVAEGVRERDAAELRAAEEVERAAAEAAAGGSAAAAGTGSLRPSNSAPAGMADQKDETPPPPNEPIDWSRANVRQKAAEREAILARMEQNAASAHRNRTLAASQSAAALQLQLTRDGLSDVVPTAADPTAPASSLDLVVVEEDEKHKSIQRDQIAAVQKEERAKARSEAARQRMASNALVNATASGSVTPTHSTAMVNPSMNESDRIVNRHVSPYLKKKLTHRRGLSTSSSVPVIGSGTGAGASGGSGGAESGGAQKSVTNAYRRNVAVLQDQLMATSGTGGGGGAFGGLTLRKRESFPASPEKRRILIVRADRKPDGSIPDPTAPVVPPIPKRSQTSLPALNTPALYERQWTSEEDGSVLVNAQKEANFAAFEKRSAAAAALGIQPTAHVQSLTPAQRQERNLRAAKSVIGVGFDHALAFPPALQGVPLPERQLTYQEKLIEQQKTRALIEEQARLQAAQAMNTVVHSQLIQPPLSLHVQRQALKSAAGESLPAVSESEPLGGGKRSGQSGAAPDDADGEAQPPQTDDVFLTQTHDEQRAAAAAHTAKEKKKAAAKAAAAQKSGGGGGGGGGASGESLIQTEALEHDAVFRSYILQFNTALQAIVSHPERQALGVDTDMARLCFEFMQDFLGRIAVDDYRAMTGNILQQLRRAVYCADASVYHVSGMDSVTDVPYFDIALQLKQNNFDLHKRIEELRETMAQQNQKLTEFYAQQTAYTEMSRQLALADTTTKSQSDKLLTIARAYGNLEKENRELKHSLSTAYATRYEDVTKNHMHVNTQALEKANRKIIELQSTVQQLLEENSKLKSAQFASENPKYAKELADAALMKNASRLSVLSLPPPPSGVTPSPQPNTALSNAGGGGGGNPNKQPSPIPLTGMTSPPPPQQQQPLSAHISIG